MAIKKISVRNFKSFDKLDLVMSDLTVLVGKNASGKSNFVDIFTFLRDISLHGLKNAVSMRGGSKYVCNTNLGTSKELKITVLMDSDYSYALKFNDEGPIVARGTESQYSFSVKFNRAGSNFRITEESLKQHVEVNQLVFDDNKKLVGSKQLGSGRVHFQREGEKIGVGFDLPIDLQGVEDVFAPTLGDEIFRDSLLFAFEKRFPMTLNSTRMIRDIVVFDIDPKLPKTPLRIAGKIELEENGSNLSLVLQNILANKEDKRLLLNLLHDLLPFVDNLRIERVGDKSLLFKLKESYSEKGYLPASFLSDGTIHLVALIVALYFSKSDTIIIEEPERGIHPKLMSKISAMLEEVSENKQIIVTTHNPELVKQTSHESLRLISRNRKGMSRITRPADSDAVQVFLKNEIGLDELFVQDILGV